jgi:hypothetical protein
MADGALLAEGESTLRASIASVREAPPEARPIEDAEVSPAETWRRPGT